MTPTLPSRPAVELSDLLWLAVLSLAVLPGLALAAGA